MGFFQFVGELKEESESLFNIKRFQCLGLVVENVLFCVYRDQCIVKNKDYYFIFVMIVFFFKLDYYVEYIFKCGIY